MIVRKVRGQEKVGKIIVSRAEADSVRKMGVALEDYIKIQLYRIAKKRRWKWYFKERRT